MIRRPPRSTLFPYPPLSRSMSGRHSATPSGEAAMPVPAVISATGMRSEEHTPELQSHLNLVCRLLLEKKKKPNVADHSNPQFFGVGWQHGALSIAPGDRSVS